MIDIGKSQDTLQKEFERVIENICNEILMNTIIEDGKRIENELKERISIAIKDINKFNKENIDKLFIDIDGNIKTINNTFETIDRSFVYRREEIKNILFSELTQISNEFNQIVNKSKTDLNTMVYNAKSNFEVISREINYNIDKVVNDCEKSVINIKNKCESLENNISNINKSLEDDSQKLKNSAEKITTEVEKLQKDNQKSIQ